MFGLSGQAKKITKLQLLQKLSWPLWPQNLLIWDVLPFTIPKQFLEFFMRKLVIYHDMRARPQSLQQNLPRIWKFRSCLPLPKQTRQTNCDGYET